MSDPQAELYTFLARFTPGVAESARHAIATLHDRLPHAVRLVYDNYNALAVGFGPDERASNAILSIAVYPRWASLFFLQGVGLPDPEGLLKGKGKVVRHIVLHEGDALDRPAVRELIETALARAKVPLPTEGGGQLIIKSVSARQRPRRPADAMR